VVAKRPQYGPYRLTSLHCSCCSRNLLFFIHSALAVAYAYLPTRPRAPRERHPSLEAELEAKTKNHATESIKHLLRSMRAPYRHATRGPTTNNSSPACTCIAFSARLSSRHHAAPRTPPSANDRAYPSLPSLRRMYPHPFRLSLPYPRVPTRRRRPYPYPTPPYLRVGRTHTSTLPLG
jgi:hypothetical protein